MLDSADEEVKSPHENEMDIDEDEQEDRSMSLTLSKSLRRGSTNRGTAAAFHLTSERIDKTQDENEAPSAPAIITNP